MSDDYALTGPEKIALAALYWRHGGYKIDSGEFVSLQNEIEKHFGKVDQK